MLQPLILKILQQTCRFMSLYIKANKSLTMKHIHRLQISLNYFYFSFNTIHFTLKLGRGRVVLLLISEKILKLGKQTLIFLLVNCIS